MVIAFMQKHPYDMMAAIIMKVLLRGNVGFLCFALQVVLSEGKMNSHSGSVYSLALIPGTSLAFSSSADDTVRLWDLAGSKLLGTVGQEGSVRHSDDVRCIRLHPDGLFLASASDDNRVIIWNGVQRAVSAWRSSQPGKQVAATLKPAAILPHSDWVLVLAWAPCGKVLATGGKEHKIKLWDVEHLSSAAENGAF